MENRIINALVETFIFLERIVSGVGVTYWLMRGH